MKTLVIILVCAFCCSCSGQMFKTKQPVRTEESKKKDRKTLRTTVIMLAAGYVLFTAVIPLTIDDINNR